MRVVLEKVDDAPTNGVVLGLRKHVVPHTRSCKWHVEDVANSGFGLTVPEWRLLSLLAHAKSLPFAELVVQSTSDKALVSRTLRLLEKRGFVELRAEGSTPRKALTCSITPAGDALHAKVIPMARRRQAEAIGVMTPEERRVVYRALKRVQQASLQRAPLTANDGND